MGAIKKINFKALDVEDIYSASMFLLYKLNNIKEYSVISELPYILDREELLKFCNYFGGMTIKVPTVKELDDVFKLILLYQYKIAEGRSDDQCKEALSLGIRDFDNLSKELSRLEPILNEYNAEIRKKYN